MMTAVYNYFSKVSVSDSKLVKVVSKAYTYSESTLQYLWKAKGHSDAVHIARELHADIVNEFGPSDVHLINAAIKLAMLLEKGATTCEEPVSIYKHVSDYLSTSPFWTWTNELKRLGRHGGDL